MGKIIAVVNNKGGVGKTTVALNLAHAIANRGMSVLVGDLDNQCNATSNFFTTAPDSTLYELLDGDGVEASKCIYPTEYERMYFIPNTEETGPLELELLDLDDKGYQHLTQRLRPYATSRFDFTFLDCPPNLGLFSIQAMACADYVICPITSGSRYATSGLDKTIRMIESIREDINPNLRFLRLLFNLVDRRESIDKAYVASIQEEYQGLVFETMIPRCTSVKQAESLGQTILRAAPKCSAADKFRRLAVEFIGMVGE